MSVAHDATWAVAFFVLVAWSLDRVHTYFIGTEQAAATGFKELLLTNTTEPGLLGFVDWLVAGYFHEKQAFMRFHIASAATFALIAPLQFTALVRNRLPWLHKILGYVFVTSMLATLVPVAYFLWVQPGGTSHLGPAVGICDQIALVVMAACVPLGVYFAWTRQYHNHRRAMIMATAVASHIPTQRVLWVILSHGYNKAHYDTAGEFGLTLTVSVALAMCLVVAVGLFCAFGPGSSSVELPPNVQRILDAEAKLKAKKAH